MDKLQLVSQKGNTSLETTYINKWMNTQTEKLNTQSLYEEAVTYTAYMLQNNLYLKHNTTFATDKFPWHFQVLTQQF